MSVANERFSTILVANRGEIACRILRTANRLGYRTVAVFSTADRDALHVELADEAIAIGEPPAALSYLNIERIIKAAQDSGAQAVHPGYGFLSENAGFAQACADAGIVFIGPGVEAITLMGNKAAARRRMLHAGVACLPGYQDADQSDDALARAAESIGYPVMIKAAAGGGGRGMRLVESADDFASALSAARSEASAAFASDEVILERALVRPRHVEVQVLADAHGNVLHLGERDCSVQRRHQKVIEEAPCPALGDDLRSRMGQAAVTVARDIGYQGAGTVEFLLSEEGEFYFMEMNTRLQVEHPVTEAITGRDLVADQIRIAQGEALDFSQQDVALSGHAIEVRLYAEDPAAHFLPSAGRVELLRLPCAEGIRVDAGIRSADVITPHYDPLVAKIIAWGETRAQALGRLRHALESTALLGLASNRDFLLDTLTQPAFSNGSATTAFIDEHYPDGCFDASKDPQLKAMAALAQHCALAERAFAASVCVTGALRHWSNGASLTSAYRYDDGETLRVRNVGEQQFEVEVAERVEAFRVLEHSPQSISLESEGRKLYATCHLPDARRILLASKRATAAFTNTLGLPAPAADGTGDGQLLAPMHGIILSLDVAAGERVTKGTRLCVLEAMKMQHELLATSDGEVSAVHVSEGEQVGAQALLLEISPHRSGDSPQAPGEITLPQAIDFRDESETLYELIATLDDHDFERVTQFKSWTVNDVITHLHVWNQAADMALHDEAALTAFLGKVRIAMASGDIRDAERALVSGLKGTALREQWRAFYRAMVERFATADPKARVKWAGPDMSVRSSITARLMETWAHGQELFDLLGVERVDADRIRNIVILGINTFAWTFKNRGETPPESPPRVSLIAPSGERWEWHAENDTDCIEGSATEFCQVVTQVRNVADTQLAVTGEVAQAWMQRAQCFAGPAQEPPVPGSRYRVVT